MLRVLKDLSLWGVIAGNALSFYMALSQGWNVGELMWVFWGQSIIIGIINIFRMLSLNDFSTEGLKSNGKPVPETRAGQISTAGFFAVHYGFFHLVYFVFLWQEQPLNIININALYGIGVCIIGFLGAHFYSFSYNFADDFRDQKPNLGALMFYPYMRIIPLHLTIIFGQILGSGMIVLFLILKTLADCGMHIAEHKLFRKASKSTPF